MIVALAVPPPAPMVCRPYRPPVRSSSCSNVAISLAPEQPSGWPRAIAPPLGLTLDMSGCSSRSQASTDGRERLVDLEDVDVADASLARCSTFDRRRDRRGEA